MMIQHRLLVISLFEFKIVVFLKGNEMYKTVNGFNAAYPEKKKLSASKLKTTYILGV